MERVFDKFYRGSGVAGRPGAGLGLTICRGIVELHGGKIAAENRPGGGAVFRFTLPLGGDLPSALWEQAVWASVVGLGDGWSTQSPRPKPSAQTERVIARTAPCPPKARKSW